MANISDSLLIQIRLEAAPNQPVKQFPVSHLQGPDKFEALIRKAVAMTFQKDDPAALDLKQYDWELKYQGKIQGWMIDIDSALELDFAFQQLNEGFIMMTFGVVDKQAPALIQPAAATAVKKAAKPKVAKKKSAAKHARPLPLKKKGKTSVSDKIIMAIAESAALGNDSPPRIQVALAAGYSCLTSTGFAKAVSGMKTSGLIEYPDPKTIRLTAAGLATDAAVNVEPPKTTEEVHERIKALLKPTACKIFDVLSDGQAHGREAVALPADTNA